MGERRADHARDRRGARGRASRDADLRRHRRLGAPGRRGDAPRDRVAARPLAPAALGRADAARRLARRPRRPGAEGVRLADEGVRSSEIASRLKMHPFVAEKSAKQAGNFSPDELAQATVRLAELDAARRAARASRRAPARADARRDHAPAGVARASFVAARRRRASRPATCGARRCSCGGRRSPRRGRATGRARGARSSRLARRRPRPPRRGAA